MEEDKAQKTESVFNNNDIHVKADRYITVLSSVISDLAALFVNESDAEERVKQGVKS